MPLLPATQRPDRLRPVGALRRSKALAHAMRERGIETTGDASALSRLAGLLDPGDPDFSVVTS
ncbi:alkyl sulfatase C-terminal domain-containing protein [Streptomyces sp. NBC_01013]|uniref:alkyl sulfatase C-terminal domain-containing protein n=1 Tax=Streptomyces sp. NBC_01013 TaxID=2903718 RepID=UPI00386FFB99|nr:hypothetical protein OG538_16895 [Streptomyces sp. NBC_01013]